jgi:hypothetical protein
MEGGGGEGGGGGGAEAEAQRRPLVSPLAAGLAAQLDVLGEKRSQWRGTLGPEAGGAAGARSEALEALQLCIRVDNGGADCRRLVPKLLDTPIRVQPMAPGCHSLRVWLQDDEGAMQSAAAEGFFEADGPAPVLGPAEEEGLEELEAGATEARRGAAEEALALLVACGRRQRHRCAHSPAHVHASCAAGPAADGAGQGQAEAAAARELAGAAEAAARLLAGRTPPPQRCCRALNCALATSMLHAEGIMGGRTWDALLETRFLAAMAA